jgi:hypothetical protein
VNGTRRADQAAADEQLSEDALMAAADAMARATGAPSSATLAELLAEAAVRPGDLTPDQIRDLGAAAIRQSWRVSFLLGKLSGVLGDEAVTGDGH